MSKVIEENDEISVDLDINRIAQICIEHKKEMLLTHRRVSGCDPDAVLSGVQLGLTVKIKRSENVSEYEKLTVGDLKKFWKKSGLTLRVISEFLGMSYDNIRQYVTKKPSRRKLKRKFARNLQTLLLNPDLWKDIKRLRKCYEEPYTEAEIRKKRRLAKQLQNIV